MATNGTSTPITERKKAHVVPRCWTLVFENRCDDLCRRFARQGCGALSRKCRSAGSWAIRASVRTGGCGGGIERESAPRKVSSDLWCRIRKFCQEANSRARMITEQEQKKGKYFRQLEIFVGTVFGTVQVQVRSRHDKITDCFRASWKCTSAMNSRTSQFSMRSQKVFASFCTKSYTGISSGRPTSSAASKSLCSFESCCLGSMKMTQMP